MKTILPVAAAFVVATYVVAYGTLYHFGQPAANLTYWVYSDRTPDWAEKCLYYGFYPPYFLHQRLLGGARHNYDRPEPWFPPAYKW